MRSLKKLSIIVPCFNEQEVIESTHQRLVGVLDGLIQKGKCKNFEILYVDDGSKDNTAKVLEGIFDKDKNVRVILLRRNFGLQGALSAGLAMNDADAAVTIDADLQDPPEAIEQMIAFYEDGYDLVLGVREDRHTDKFLKRIMAESFYNFMKFLGANVVYNHGDFRLMAKALVDEFNTLTERNRFIRGMILTLDHHYAKVFYKREARTLGVTKFSLKKMLSFSLDGILSFSFVPLRIISIVGVFTCLAALLSSVCILYSKIAGHVVPGWTSTVLPIFIFSGIQILSLGIIGEYMGRLYVEIKQRPLFSVRKELKHG